MIKKNIFRPGDILLPKNCDMTLWSTVACDQFSSDQGYWDTVAAKTADVPSTMHLMLPEAYLQTVDQQKEGEKINRTMEQYLSSDVFTTLEQSYIFVERTLPGGSVRRGLVGVLDLEQYDYAENSQTPIRATEHTVESRLPPRVAIRQQACLEMPHIMVFIDDPADTVMSCAEQSVGNTLYDFELMCGGGHIRGMQIEGKKAADLSAQLDALADDAVLTEKYGRSEGAILYAMGDGNHSLAAARKCWEMVRDKLSPEEKMTHPARFALVELVNIHDAGIMFHPIHRTVFQINPADFAAKARTDLFSEQGTAVTMVFGGITEVGFVSAESIGQVIERVDRFCQTYAKAHNGEVDYIHGDEEAAAFGGQKDAASILLPAMEKGELFTSVMNTGVFCKKSFSIGEAAEKRYYLECRKIR